MDDNRAKFDAEYWTMNRNKTEPKKRAYVAPRLETFGSVAKLTQQNNDNKPGTAFDGAAQDIGNRGQGN